MDAEMKPDMVLVVSPTSFREIPRCTHIPPNTKLLIGAFGSDKWECARCAEEKIKESK